MKKGIFGAVLAIVSYSANADVGCSDLLDENNEKSKVLLSAINSIPDNKPLAKLMEDKLHSDYLGISLPTIKKCTADSSQNLPAIYDKLFSHLVTEPVNGDNKKDMAYIGQVIQYKVFDGRIIVNATPEEAGAEVALIYSSMPKEDLKRMIKAEYEEGEILIKINEHVFISIEDLGNRHIRVDSYHKASGI